MPLMEHGPLLPRGWRETNQPTNPPSLLPKRRDAREERRGRGKKCKLLRAGHELTAT